MGSATKVLVSKVLVQGQRHLAFYCSAVVLPTFKRPMGEGTDKGEDKGKGEGIDKGKNKGPDKGIGKDQFFNNSISIEKETAKKE